MRIESMTALTAVCKRSERRWSRTGMNSLSWCMRTVSVNVMLFFECVIGRVCTREQRTAARDVETPGEFYVPYPKSSLYYPGVARY